MTDRGKPRLVLRLPHSSDLLTGPFSALSRARDTTFQMVELDLDQILETTDTIVQELLATGEFG